MLNRRCSRRDFLKQSASAALLAPPIGASDLNPVKALPGSPKRVAAIATTYYRYSHADNIITRFIEGYSITGKSFPPPCKVVSLFIDQVTDLDIGRPIAKRWGVPLYKTIAEALTLGGDKLAVDGVVMVGEHGDYPDNDKGQKLYPRRQFFEQIVEVFRDSKRAVPVFSDKHLSYSWENAKWMYDQSRELGFPFMAGSSVPVTYRRPDLRPKLGVPWERALSLGYGHFEVYGFHTLEALQVMVERRGDGETGVRAVQCLEGPAAWKAAAEGRWDKALLEAAISKCPRTRPGKLEENDQNPIVYLIDYRDGLKAAAYMSPRHVGEFAFAGKVKGQDDPAACWYDLPKPQRDHFSFLVQHAADMIITGKPTTPIERTLLTGGMLDFLLDSRKQGHRRIETPQLDVRYRLV